VAGSPTLSVHGRRFWETLSFDWTFKVEHLSSNPAPVMLRGSILTQTGKEGKGLFGYQVEADPSERAWSARNL